MNMILAAVVAGVIGYYIGRRSMPNPCVCSDCRRSRWNCGEDAGR